MEGLLVFLGRLHPVAVHLPIGIFLLLAGVELVGLFPRGPRLTDAQRTFVLALGLAIAIATAIFGWLLAREGGYNAELLDPHQWSGFTFAALAAVLLVAQLLRWRRTYGGLLAASVAVLVAAGHYGGSLTHGENYLTASRVAGTRVRTKDPAEAKVFADLIHPLLEQRCVSCHGTTKSNGDLRLDTLEQLRKGGKSGALFKAGDVAASRMIRRLHLPLEAKEHMPPKGKPQPTDEEISILEWWIETGAPTDKTVVEAKPPGAISEAIALRLGIQPPAPPDRAKMLAAAEAIERRLGIIIRPLTANEPWLEANARLQEMKFGDTQLAELAAIAPALQWLDLGETAVTDAGLQHLAGMANLRRLQLDRTAVTDEGLAHLPSLPRLESLNLHATKVSDAGLAALQALPRLRSLYLWQTKVTPEAAAKFAEQQTDKRRIARWKSEIAALEANVRSEQFTANLGAAMRTVPPAKVSKPAASPVPVPAVAETPAAAQNAKCPVSGEPVDPSVTETFAGKVIAFCCERCREEFRAEPAKFPLAAKE